MVSNGAAGGHVLLGIDEDPLHQITATCSAVAGGDPSPPATPSASAPSATASWASASRLWPGAKMTASIPRSRARSATAARAALPPPDLGLTNNTGRCGGSEDRQPRPDSSDTIQYILV